MTAEIDELIRVYRKIRDKKDKERKAWKTLEQDLDTQLDLVSAALLKVMNETGVESFKTEEGTAYKQVDKKVWCENWNAMYEFIRQSPERIEQFLEKSVKKQAALDWMEDHQDTLPPGCAMSQEFVVRVRAPQAKI